MNQRHTQAEDEPVVPLIVPKPEDKDDEVGLLDVPPGFAPRDGHAQPLVVQVWIWGFFLLRFGACTVALDFGVFWLNETPTCHSLDLYCATVCCNFSECNVDFTWQIGIFDFMWSCLG